MIGRYRPTTLRIFEERCPAALEFFRKNESGAGQGKERLDSYDVAEKEIEGNEACDIGIAFHACVHMAADAVKKNESMMIAVEATAIAITSKMPPDRARAGADMAVNFLKEYTFDTRLDYESGLAFNKNWLCTGWDEGDVRLRMVLDVYGLTEVEDEDGKYILAQSEDYKTGWGATADILDGIQAKCHSTALYMLHGRTADYIEVRIHATRFRKVFSKRWDLKNNDDVEDLELRKKHVEFYMESADRSDGAARLGPGCILCDFKSQCALFRDRVQNVKDGIKAGEGLLDIIQNPRLAAVDLSILETEVKRLKAGLKEVTKNAPIVFETMILGYEKKNKRTLKDPREMLEFWFEKAPGAMASPEDAKRAARGLMMAMEPGVTQCDKMVKKIARAIGYKSQAAAIEALAPRLTNSEEQSAFKWHKKNALDDRDDNEL